MQLLLLRDTPCAALSDELLKEQLDVAHVWGRHGELGFTQAERLELLREVGVEEVTKEGS